MRTCYKCKKEKAHAEFHKDCTQVGGISYDCKQCKSETRKQKRKENPEKYREQCRQSVVKHYDTIRASQKKHRLENRETILKRRKELREPRKFEINAKEAIRRKNHRKNSPGFVENERKKLREYYAKNRAKMIPQRNAHKLVMYAVRLGLLKRPEKCELCDGTIRIEGHHEDYSKPLEVKWLCKVCHQNVHKGNLKL